MAISPSGRFYIGLSTSLFFSTVVAAAPDIAPGKWLHQYDAKSKSGKLEMAVQTAKIALKNLPAEQRAMVENMMKAQGVNASINFEELTTTYCVSPEQAKDPKPPKMDANCEISITDKLENGYKVAYRCGGQTPVNGEGVWRVIDPKHYTIDVTANLVYQGIEDTILIKQTGEWQAKDC